MLSYEKMCLMSHAAPPVRRNLVTEINETNEMNETNETNETNVHMPHHLRMKTLLPFGREEAATIDAANSRPQCSILTDQGPRLGTGVASAHEASALT